MAGIKLTQVPFKGGAETNAAVLGQHTMLQADSTGWQPLVDAGKLRLLMIWTAERSPNWPDVPTLKELGYPIVSTTRRSASPDRRAWTRRSSPKLHDAFKKALEDPAVIATLAKYDMVPNYKNTEDYKKFVVEVTESERKVIDTLGLAKKRSSAATSSEGALARSKMDAGRIEATALDPGQQRSVARRATVTERRQ